MRIGRKEYWSRWFLIILLGLGLRFVTIAFLRLRYPSLILYDVNSELGGAPILFAILYAWISPFVFILPDVASASFPSNNEFFLYFGLRNTLHLIMVIYMGSLSVKRMHDIGKTGWSIAIPIYNLIMLVRIDNEGGNQYGSPPLIKKSTLLTRKKVLGQLTMNARVVRVILGLLTILFACMDWDIDYYYELTDLFRNQDVTQMKYVFIIALFVIFSESMALIKELKKYAFYTSIIPFIVCLIAFILARSRDLNGFGLHTTIALSLAYFVTCWVNKVHHEASAKVSE